MRHLAITDRRQSAKDQRRTLKHSGLRDTLRFTDSATNAPIPRPGRRRKTHLTTALGHSAIRRRRSVLYSRAAKLFTRLRADRLDNTLDAEIRRITAVDFLIIDDFALKPLDATQTSDFYALVVERHRKKSTIWSPTANPPNGSP